MMTSPNRDILEMVAQDLAPMIPDVVFVGGQITELLISDRAVVRIRPTTDVDIVVAASTRSEFQRIETRLRSLGFTNDVRAGAPIYRWISPSGCQLDVMASDERVLGFSNEWYERAIRATATSTLANGLVITHLSAPAFVATKLAAFQSRGKGDMYGSHDLEDIISLVAGRPSLAQEVAGASPEIREWIATCFSHLLEDDDFLFVIQGALPDTALLPELQDDVVARFRVLSADPWTSR